MRTTKRLVQGAALVGGAIGTVAVAAPDTPLGRAARQFGNRLARDVRYAAASAPGIVYRLTGQRPEPAFLITKPNVRHAMTDPFSAQFRQTAGHVRPIITGRVKIFRGWLFPRDN